MLKMQKVIKVGNSLAITLDGAFVAATGIKAGDRLAAAYKPEKGLIGIAKSTNGNSSHIVTDVEQEAYITGQITPEFRHWVEQSLEEDKQSMTALKDL